MTKNLIPEYYILNSENVLGMVFKNENNNKIVLMLENKIDLQLKVEFRDVYSKEIEDIEVEEILKNFIFKKQ